MDALKRFLDPTTLNRLKGLELKARLIVEGYVSGMHKSPYHGFSVEFAEHREYVPGDDLRYVDWKVFGKSDRIYLKQYDEETNFVCHLLVDTSESMTYRSPKAMFSKLEYAQYIAAAFAYLIIHQQDAVGLATFDTSVRQFLRPGSTAVQLRQLCHTLEQSPSGGESSIGPIFHDLAERIKRRGLVVIISDFFDDPETLKKGLKHFQHRRHDVVLLQVIDPEEQDFTFVDPTLFKGLENLGEQLTEPRALRKAYQKEFEEFLKTIRSSARDFRMDYVLMRTDQPLEVNLHEFLSRRMHRAGRR
ncbi:DUF58 domain-containing protein [Schlesneria sp. DSM 10557]|uniref:DUF58 domain-containing protein n=1 Tax=Schlesneria sp. DSM 10557 TaxID=3044399 RepID=UPI0035A0DE8F